LKAIQAKQKFVKEHENELAVYAQELADRGADIKLKQCRADLQRLQKRSDELDILIKKLFEQLALGSITQERFDSLIPTYESEQKTLKEKIGDLQKAVTESDNNLQDIMRFFDLIRKHDDVTELNTEILHKFIDTIDVYQAEGVGKSKTQKIVINFRFIKDNWFIF